MTEDRQNILEFHINVGPTLIPEELKDEQVLFLTDILPISYWGVENGGVKKGDTVVILGCGSVGLLSIKWAIFNGAKRIIAVDCVGMDGKMSTFEKIETALKLQGGSTKQIEKVALYQWLVYMVQNIIFFH